MYAKTFLSFIVLFIFTSALWADEDEIIFFNVGQGHCTLIRRVNYVPLLIDAGSTCNVLRAENHQQNDQGSKKGDKVIRSIIKNISDHWRNNQNSDGKLNVIITHGQDDHVKYIPTILEGLNQGRSNICFRLLLGGKAEHYQGKLGNNFLSYEIHYSADYNHADLLRERNLGFPESDCITHLFCPRGNHDPNTWSIMTRVLINPNQTNPISAMIPGDAEKALQQQMREQFPQAQALESTILLFPHHGAKPLEDGWIKAVNPQAVIISAGKRGSYYHPRAEALCSLFSALRPSRNVINGLELNTTTQERLWNSVDSHRVIYYDTTGQFSQNVRNILPTIQINSPHSPLVGSPFEFLDVPWYINLGFDPNWRCALSNFPIYTTYTSGTIVFKKDPYNLEPFKMQFIDVPTDIEQMAQEIQNLYINDHQGDYSDFSRLSAQTQEKSFRELQKCYSDQRAREISEPQARKIFFLCYNIIPVEEKGKNESTNSYREKYLVDHLKFMRTYTEALNF